jgi:glycine cleavage system H protein
MTMVVKEGLRYTKDHEWIKVEGDTGTIGITDYAQEQLGEIVFVELPQVGKQFAAHKEISVVESSKAAGDVYCPVAGKVAEVNAELESKPELVNQDCYGAGWICKLQITDKKALDGLMDAKKYEEYLKAL